MKISYQLYFPAPETHYVSILMNITAINQDVLLLKMPVWTPGSYLIREFEKNIDFLEWSIDNKHWNRVIKSNKNTWNIVSKNVNEIIVRYNIYCFEYSVRTSYITDDFALLNGASIFLYVDEKENTPIEVEINAPATWNNISTSLIMKDNENKWLRQAANIDELIDSPIQIGNHISYFFEAANVPHELAIVGQSNCNIEKLIVDLKAIIEKEVQIFGTHPCENYVFIIHNTENSYGGLEHLNSSVNFITRWSYDVENYTKPIGLLAHEYFHLWNIKRIKPTALIPYNYNEESYTDLLWFFEGVTSYYDDYICFRANVINENEYLSIVAKNINDTINNPGKDKQTLVEASFDTWIKYYRKNENTINAHVNYYTHGAVIAMLFDFIILQTTNGEKSLDNVMKQLYADYTTINYKGITETSLLQIFNDVSGIDFSDLFNKYLHTTDDIELENAFKSIGFRLQNNTAKKWHLGLQTKWQNNQLIITSLDKNYGAYQGGLNVHDEIIAIDNFRANKNFENIFAHKNTNDTIEALVSRQGILKTYTIVLTADNRKNYFLEKILSKNESQKKLQTKWLGK